MAADAPADVLTRAVEAARRGDAPSARRTDEILEAIFSGQAPPPLIEEWLCLASARLPTTEEIWGGVQALIRSSVRLPTDIPSERIVDTAGTGGAPKLLNVSTLAALIIAACRGVVAKHGNRSRTGFGSSETLAALGVNVDAAPDVQAMMLKECGFCFCLASRHYPAARFVADARRAVATPTLFNAIGPLVNPAGALRQVVGVWSRELLAPMAEVLARGGSVKAFVVHSDDGLDEVSVSAATHAVIVERGRVIGSTTFQPEQFGIQRSRAAPRAVENLNDATTLFRRLASGVDGGPALDLVLVNAALGLMAADKAATPREASALASRAIQSGNVNTLLERVITLSNQ
jgi:anthranilate phosphoribosyltransferase